MYVCSINVILLMSIGRCVERGQVVHLLLLLLEGEEMKDNIFTQQKLFFVFVSSSISLNNYF